MKFWILEDETLAAQRLLDKVSALRPDWLCLGVIPSLKSARQQLISAEADFLFVDIHLGDGHSFEVLEDLNIQSPLIFTTAYDQYALKAFQLNSLDYLLKPINEVDLNRALTKLEQREEGRHRNWAELLADLKPTYKERFLVSSGERLRSIQSENIAFFYASGKHCFLTDETGQQYIIDQKLKDLMAKLDPKSFFQINRQFIINLNFIEELQPYSKSRVKVICKPTLPEEGVVSVERSGKFKAWLEGEV